MQIGDEIRILPGAESSYYSDGCKARLTRLDSDGDWWADFNNSENSPGSYDEDEGVWCVGKADRFELVTPETSTPTVAQLQARVAELEAARAHLREALEDIASGEITRSHCTGPHCVEELGVATADEMASRAAGALDWDARA